MIAAACCSGMAPRCCFPAGFGEATGESTQVVDVKDCLASLVDYYLCCSMLMVAVVVSCCMSAADCSAVLVESLIL